MADFARRGDQAQWMANMARQTSRMRTKRPLNWAAKTFTIHVYGEIEAATESLPAKIMIDETGADFPEHKQIVAVDARLLGGSLTMNWAAEGLGVFHTGHTVVGDDPSNFVLLPEPYIIENGASFGDWFKVEFTAVSFALDLAASFTVQTVPV